MSEYISGLRKKNHKISFIPTMGGLHEGHISLITRSKKEKTKLSNDSKYIEQLAREKFRMAKKGIIITLGEFGHLRWKRTDFVEKKYNITDLKNFNFG